VYHYSFISETAFKCTYLSSLKFPVSYYQVVVVVVVVVAAAAAAAATLYGL
jgi:hypothetical protein